jgi:hypothetical protein
MTKVLFAVLALGMFVLTMAGCHAEGDVGHTNSSVAAPQ